MNFRQLLSIFSQISLHKTFNFIYTDNVLTGKKENQDYRYKNIPYQGSLPETSICLIPSPFYFYID